MTTKQKITSSAKINPTTKIIYPEENDIGIQSTHDDIELDNSNTDSNTHSENSQTVPNIFREKIIKFIKLDDAIREETIAFKEKIETLKLKKEEVSSYILRHLEDVEEEEIDLANKGKLKRYESKRKSGLNKDIIRQSIYEKLKNEKLVKTDEEGRLLAQATYDIMEGKREVKTKVTLKRTIKKEKKPKVENDSKKSSTKK